MKDYEWLLLSNEKEPRCNRVQWFGETCNQRLWNNLGWWLTDFWL